ncbi:hypothetical protein F2P81_008955 [Scophthalmus maximus]|uniref:Uncharacterized protein n=1 Tax=Scophthalmus maximus TaxID=52904 RepID=A0A6A4T5S8_SCOMX|nr:hypothetical protein F2P81_008955 [Scophthalmus maximus]
MHLKPTEKQDDHKDLRVRKVSHCITHAKTEDGQCIGSEELTRILKCFQCELKNTGTAFLLKQWHAAWYVIQYWIAVQNLLLLLSQSHTYMLTFTLLLLLVHGPESVSLNGTPCDCLQFGFSFPSPYCGSNSDQWSIIVLLTLCENEEKVKQKN